MKKRKPGAGGNKRRNVILPAELSDQLDELLFDPVYKRTRYGGFSQLVTKLLQNWLAEVKEAQKKDAKND